MGWGGGRPLVLACSGGKPRGPSARPSSLPGPEPSESCRAPWPDCGRGREATGPHSGPVERAQAGRAAAASPSRHRTHPVAAACRGEPSWPPVASFLPAFLAPAPGCLLSLGSLAAPQCAAAAAATAGSSAPPPFPPSAWGGAAGLAREERERQAKGRSGMASPGNGGGAGSGASEWQLRVRGESQPVTLFRRARPNSGLWSRGGLTKRVLLSMYKERLLLSPLPTSCNLNWRCVCSRRLECVTLRSTIFECAVFF